MRTAAGSCTATSSPRTLCSRAARHALGKVPADRYPTTALFAEALNTPSAATGAHRRATLDRAVRRPRSALWRIAPVAAVVVALAAYLAIRSARAGRGAATGGLDPRHVAVLYFEDESNGKTLGYLADGLTEALIAELSRIQPLVVTSRNGVAQFRQDSIAPDSIARALDAGTLVQGAVNDVGGRVRVSRSEEHTSELQSRSDLVCRLLLEKKKSS